MKYKALVSFVGQLSMSKGKVMEISNKELISDLLKAKYIEEIKEEKKEIKVTAKKKK
jgi:hypothetical protein